MNYHWQIASLSPEQHELVTRLSAELRISEAAASLLVHRGLTTAEQARAFIRPSLDTLHDPYQMKDMHKAVDRVEKALRDGEKILIYGDYDVDGTTAVALMWRFLSGLTHRLDYYIPDRHEEGYGISYKGVDYAKAQGCSLIIALDCGILEFAKVAYANEKHIDMVICDHHTPGDRIPEAVAVLNMHRSDCPYPFKDLSGCGVGFKLVQALVERLGMDRTCLNRLMQLLALSIAADVVSMTDENRVLAAFGIRQINDNPYPGVKALMDVVGVDAGKMNTTELLYKMAPRLNACGRMRSGADAVELLISDNRDICLERACHVDANNEERRECERRAVAEALAMIAADADDSSRYTTVVYKADWHKGVVGIVASRLTETHYRPTIVLTAGQGDIISGSARSVGDFDIYQAILSCRDVLTNFGGHPFAAGLSMRLSDLPTFKARFEAYVAAHISPASRRPTLFVESELKLSDITPQFYSVLTHLEPYGPGNPRPLFVTRRLVNNRDTRAVGKDHRHLHLDLTDREVAISGIAFSRADMAVYIANGYPVDVCYEVQENTFNHRTTLQMVASDIIPSDSNQPSYE